MSGRVYSVTFQAVAVTAVQDLFELLAGSSFGFHLLSVHLSQSTEIADAEEEMMRIAIEGHSGAITSGSGGSAGAEVPTNIGNAASGVVSEINNTTEMSGGAKVTHHEEAWNVRVPMTLIWMPETRIYVAPTDGLTVTLLSTPTDSITMSGTIYYEEN